MFLIMYIKYIIQINVISPQDYMDPKLMMLRLDVQQVINNLDQTRRIEDRNDQQQ